MVNLAPNACPNCRNASVEGDRFCTTCGWCLFLLDSARAGRRSRSRHLLGGRYELVREAGQGPASRVALAFDGEDGFVAIKQMKIDRDSRAQIMQSEALTRTLLHENVLPRLRLWTADDSTLAVMPWVEGASLRDIIESDGTLSAGEVVFIATNIAAALSAAHVLGIIHRGVRPSNILIDLAGTPMLGDFGMSAVGDPPDKSSDRHAANSSLYVSPEQVRGAPVSASDQYALGIVCYEMLGGRGAIGGTLADSPKDAAHDTAPTIGVVGAAMPIGLEGVVLRMLSARAEDRYRSAAELSAALAVIPVVPADRAREQLVERIARVRHRRVVQEMLRAVGPASMQVSRSGSSPAIETGGTASAADGDEDTLPAKRRTRIWERNAKQRIALIVTVSVSAAAAVWLALR